MSKPTVNVRIWTGPLAKLKKVLSFGANGTAHPRTIKMYKRIGYLYRSFAQRRYVKASRGDGTWVPLKGERKRNIAANQRRQRRAAKTGKPFEYKYSAILRDTNTLFGALNPFSPGPGGIEEITNGGVELGFGGDAIHKLAPLSIADLAAIHHFGTKHIPERPIIVDPDTQTIKQIQREVHLAQQDIIDELSTLRK